MPSQQGHTNRIATVAVLLPHTSKRKSKARAGPRLWQPSHFGMRLRKWRALGAAKTGGIYNKTSKVARQERVLKLRC